MKLSRSLTILFLSLVYLWSIKILAVTTVDCLNCETTATPGVTPGTANAAQLAALVTDISARDRRLGCSLIKTDNDFDTVTSRLSVSPEGSFLGLLNVTMTGQMKAERFLKYPRFNFHS